MLKLNPVHFIKPVLIICSHSNYVLLRFTHPNIKYFYLKYFINDNNTGVRASERPINQFIRRNIQSARDFNSDELELGPIIVYFQIYL